MPESDESGLSDATGNFALKLYSELVDPEKNLFFSPISIFTALSMVYAGASNVNKKEMADLLNLSMVSDDIHLEIKNQIKHLLTKSGYQLKFANALWLQIGYSLLNKYMFIINRNYDGSVYEVDFRKISDACAKINAWVVEQTRNKIQEIVNAGSIDENTKLVIINAIYFKAKWHSPFSKSLTENQDFTLISGKKITVPMMHKTRNYFYYHENEEYQAIHIPYEGRSCAMIVFLPKNIEGIISLEKKLINLDFKNNKQFFKGESVEIFFPKFKIETNYRLRERLINLGMKDAFKDDADFSKMTDHEEGMTISEVIHKTFVNVDEEGTEAAAVTATIMRAGSALPQEEPIIFRADHPFLFMIYTSETILFIGKVMNPLQ